MTIGKNNQPTKGMSAETIFWLANWVFIATLIVGVLATFAIVLSGNIKEEKLKRELAAQNERAAHLEVKAAQMNSENVILQKVMMNRTIGTISIDGPPPAHEYFAGIENFHGTPIWIQAADDPEARNLSVEISGLLKSLGWIPTFVDEKVSHLASSSVDEGIVVYSREPSWKEKDPAILWGGASKALADALTKAGLGILDRPINAPFITPQQVTDKAPPYFVPPLNGVFLWVGSRPVSKTIQLMKFREKNGKTADEHIIQIISHH